MLHERELTPPSWLSFSFCQFSVQYLNQILTKTIDIVLILVNMYAKLVYS